MIRLPSNMIHRYNFRQILRAGMFVILASGAYVLAASIFTEMIWSLDRLVFIAAGASLPQQGLILVMLLLLMTAGGVSLIRKGQVNFESPAMFANVRSSEGFWMRDPRLSSVQIDIIAYNQIFLAGPIWIYKAWLCLKSLIQNSPRNEQQMHQMLCTIKDADEWQALEEYSKEDWRTIILLAKIGAIEFSHTKGRFRSKRNADDNAGESADDDMGLHLPLRIGRIALIIMCIIVFGWAVGFPVTVPQEARSVMSVWLLGFMLFLSGAWTASLSIGPLAESPMQVLRIFWLPAGVFIMFLGVLSARSAVMSSRMLQEAAAKETVRK